MEEVTPNWELETAHQYLDDLGIALNKESMVCKSLVGRLQEVLPNNEPTEVQKWIDTTIEYLRDMKYYAQYDTAETKEKTIQISRLISELRGIPNEINTKIREYVKELTT